MKVAELTAFGVPEDVVECSEVADPGSPADDEVLVEMAFCPINPAELLLIQGKYASKPPLPARLGIEGAGRVIAVGDAIDDLQAGAAVMSLSRTNWTQQALLKRGQVIKLPAGIDLQQAAMLKVNPATALKMLDDYVELQAGDWVIQNAANSGVGTCLIQLARQRGVKTINVVRRQSLIQPLTRLGADLVVVAGDDLGQRVRAEIGDQAKVKLAIDAVAGPACMQLADCLSDGGIVVNYGLLSGQPCMLTAEQTVFRGLTLTGFWLAKVMQSMAPAELQSLYATLAEHVTNGAIRVAVEKVYPLTEVKQALQHAMREGRAGKILLAPNG